MPLTASDISRTDVWAPVWCAFQPKHSRHLQAWDCSLILISKACSPSPAALEMEVNDSCMKSNPSPQRAGTTLLNVPAVYLHAFILYLSSGKLTVFRWPHVLSFFPPSLSKSIKLFHLLPRRLIRCNLKSKILDSTFSDGIACSSAWLFGSKTGYLFYWAVLTSVQSHYRQAVLNFLSNQD